MKTKKKITLSTIGAILAILVTLTQLIKEVPAVVAAIAPSKAPDTVYVIQRAPAGSVEVPDSVVKSVARMSK